MRPRARVACTLGLGCLGFLAGCERLLSLHDPVASDGRGLDTGGCDTGPIDGGLGPGSPILLSEIVLTPTAGEMIEIVNTSSQPVDLSTYYLSDSGNGYFRLPAQKVVDQTDFIAKFPNNTMIPGHGVFTIAIDGVMFSTQYGKAPTFSLANPGSMELIASTTLAPALTNDGEPVILFQWDGRSDLVRDVDIMIVGTPKAGNTLVDKSGMSQDGPDDGLDPRCYATDANTIKQHLQATAPGNNQSTQRIALEGSHETHGGGNGPSGDDETSEDISATWDGTAGHAYGAPTPGDVPPELTP